MGLRTGHPGGSCPVLTDLGTPGQDSYGEDNARSQGLGFKSHVGTEVWPGPSGGRDPRLRPLPSM